MNSLSKHPEDLLSAKFSIWSTSTLLYSLTRLKRMSVNLLVFASKLPCYNNKSILKNYLLSYFQTNAVPSFRYIPKTEKTTQHIFLRDIHFILHSLSLYSLRVVISLLLSIYDFTRGLLSPALRNTNIFQITCFLFAKFVLGMK
jgi:hypothetical protein